MIKTKDAAMAIFLFLAGAVLLTLSAGVWPQ